MHFFYAPDLLATGGNVLPDEEWKHIKALRVRPFEQLKLVDGKGSAQEFRFHLNDKIPSLDPLSDIVFTDRPQGPHVCIPMTQQVDRIEWMLEKSTEMGIRGLTIIQTQLSEKVKFSKERLERIAVAAMKQSQRSWLPEVNYLESWGELLIELSGKSIYIAHCNGGEKMDLSSVNSNNPFFLIGPEGDFTPTEVSDIVAIGGKPLSLGTARLRTETAGLLVVSKYYLS